MTESMRLVPALLIAVAASLTIQVFGQSDGDVAKARQIKADEEVRPMSGEPPISFKLRSLPVLNLSNSDVAAYDTNPANQPKLDFKPTSKGKKAQPKSAGVSHLKASKQIIGGTTAFPKQYPWQLYMIVDKQWLCGGSVISANWVLTAAHCVFGGVSFVITVGGIDRTSVETGEKTLTSTVAIIHEKYNDNTLVNDVAVIKLPSALTLNLYINVVRLPKLSEASKTFVNTAVTATGYGWTTNTGSPSVFMMTVGLTVIANSVCSGVFGPTSVINSTICTGASSTKSICSGDSGGPLMVLEADAKFTQIGIVSFKSLDSCTNNPAGYARVTSFLGWISTKTGIAIRP